MESCTGPRKRQKYLGQVYAQERIVFGKAANVQWVVDTVAGSGRIRYCPPGWDTRTLAAPQTERAQGYTSNRVAKGSSFPQALNESVYVSLPSLVALTIAVCLH